MLHSLPWEVGSPSVLSRNVKASSQSHELGPILSQLNPAYNFASHFFKIQFIFILTSTLRNPKWSPSAILQYRFICKYTVTNRATLHHSRTFKEFKLIICETDYFYFFNCKAASAHTYLKFVRLQYLS